MKTKSFIAVLLAVCAVSLHAAAGEITPAGEKMAATVDSMHVDKLWLAGAQVDWRSGEPNGKVYAVPNGHTHCSAFAAACAEKLGIYLLRPPAHSANLLANAQQDWLRTVGTNQGWYAVGSMLQAQELANRGELVLVTCKNPDPKLPGHVAVVRPSTKSEKEILAEGPQITQAGRHNYISTTTLQGFKNHTNAFENNLLLYFAHAVSTVELDIDASDEVAGTAEETNRFLNIVTNQFARWDLNHDGVLSSNELDVAVADPHTTGPDAAAIAALKRAARNPKVALPPLTVENIATLTAEQHPDFARMFREGLQLITAETNRTLFGGGAPKLETIHQGKLGNCFTLAPLGAMVYRDPAQVAGMFSTQSNGDYSVRLGKQTVVVTPPTDAEIAMTSSNERGGLWVNVYEKAVGTARNDARPADERAESPLDALARGGSAGTMLAFITGHDMVRFSFKFAKDTTLSPADREAKLVDLRSQLADATAKKNLMTCGTLKVTTPGLHPNHAYAVLGYKPEADAVTLWNPHGQNFTPKGAPGPDYGHETKNGVFDISLKEFVQQFSGMAFEVAEKKPQA